MHAIRIESGPRSRTLQRTVGLLGLLLVTGGAYAQEAAGSAESQPVEPSRLSFSLTGDTEFGLSADLDDDGEVSTTRVGADFGVRYRLNDRVGLSLGLGAEYSFYDFDEYETVPGGGDPIDDAFLYDLVPTISFNANDHWTFIGGGIFRWAGEEDADLGDAFTAGALGAVHYRVSDQLTLGFGCIVATRLEDDTFVVPALVIDWKINDKWTLTNDAKPALVVKYQAMERLELSLGAWYTTRDYRLDDDNAIPEGAMEDTRIPVAFAASWRAMDHLTLTGRVGAFAYHKFEFNNADGDEVDDQDVDPSIFFGLEAKVTF